MEADILAPGPGPSQQPIDSRECRDTSSKITNESRDTVSPTRRQATQRLPITSWAHSHFYTCSKIWPLPTRGTRPSSTHQGAGTSPFCRKLAQASRPSLNHQGTSQVRNHSPAACRLSPQMQARQHPGTSWPPGPCMLKGSKIIVHT